MGKEINARLELATKTTAEWAEITSPITKGVPCVEMTTDGKTRMKIGDGVNTYDKLPYVTASGEIVIIDDCLSESSENPVMNKVITDEFAKCLKTTASLVLKCSL